MKFPKLPWTTLGSVLATIIILAGIGFYAGLFGAADKPDAPAAAEIKGSGIL